MSPPAALHISNPGEGLLPRTAVGMVRILNSVTGKGIIRLRTAEDFIRRGRAVWVGDGLLRLVMTNSENGAAQRQATAEAFRSVHVDCWADGIRGSRAPSRVMKCRDDSRAPVNRVLQRAAPMRDTGLVARIVHQRPQRAIAGVDALPLEAPQRDSVRLK